MKVLTFDIGGMSIKYTIFENNEKVIDIKNKKYEKPTFALILNIIKKIYDTHINEIDAIAISTAGALNEETYIEGQSAILEMTKINFLDTIKRKLNYKGKIIAINDGNAMAFADYSTVEENKNVVSIAVGTGIGAGLIINKNIVVGKNGFGGEIGGMLLDIQTENYLKNSSSSFRGSMFSVQREYLENTKISKTAKEIFELYDNHDKEAIKVVSNMYKALAIVVFNVSMALNPDVIFIGGGLGRRSKSGSELMRYVNELLKSRNLDKFDFIDIKNSKFGGDAQLYGAYKYLIKKTKYE